MPLNIHWKDWCWSSNSLATWCEEPTHWKTLWCWELRARGEAGSRGWHGWMASPTQWTRVWANSGRWWRIGKPGVLQSMGLQRVGHDLATKQQKKILNVESVDMFYLIFFPKYYQYIFLEFLHFYWNVDLQCCVSDVHQNYSVIHIYIHVSIF